MTPTIDTFGLAQASRDISDAAAKKKFFDDEECHAS